MTYRRLSAYEITTAVALLSLGCSASNAGASSHDPLGTGGSKAPSSGEPATTGAGGTGSITTGTGAELCDGYDNDLNGRVDDGCPCAAGQTQACFPGLPGTEGLGICGPGVQECEAVTAEFGGEWGGCSGATLPAAETCGDGLDADCDGLDPPCEDGSGGTAGVGGSAGAAGESGAGGCAPLPEICGNGIDEDCDGADVPCPELCQDISLFGDCLTVSCPPTHPHPASCAVFFTPGDDRGCVASAPGNSSVYFQAGDSCSKGFITGTLCCSTTPMPPLDAASCPINKPQQIHTATSAGCPTTS